MLLKLGSIYQANMSPYVIRSWYVDSYDESAALDGKERMMTSMNRISYNMANLFITSRLAMFRIMVVCLEISSKGVSASRLLLSRK